MQFERSETGTTPRVIIDSDANVFEIEGRSLAENAAEFYGEIVDHLDEYLKDSGSEMELRIKLDYCNTSSYLGLSHVLKKLRELNEGNCAFTVKWLYESGDEDWLEDGRNFQEAVEIPFVFEAFEVS